MDQRGDQIKINFEYFQIQKWMLQTVRVEKVDKKMFSHLFSLYVPFLSYGVKLSKKVNFLQFCADLNKRSKSIKVI